MYHFTILSDINWKKEDIFYKKQIFSPKMTTKKFSEQGGIVVLLYPYFHIKYI